MSEKPYTARHILIIKKLEETTYATHEEIESYIKNKAEYAVDLSLQKGVSKKTLQRDINDIGAHRGIEIKYSRAHKAYFISDRMGEDESFKKVLDAFFEFTKRSFKKNASTRYK